MGADQPLHKGMPAAIDLSPPEPFLLGLTRNKILDKPAAPRMRHWGSADYRPTLDAWRSRKEED